MVHHWGFQQIFSIILLSPFLILVIVLNYVFKYNKTQISIEDEIQSFIDNMMYILVKLSDDIIILNEIVDKYSRHHSNLKTKLLQINNIVDHMNNDIRTLKTQDYNMLSKYLDVQLAELKSKLNNVNDIIEKENDNNLTEESKQILKKIERKISNLTISKKVRSLIDYVK